MHDIIHESGEGFYSYTWTKPGTDRKDNVKISFIKHFEPFDWFFGTGEYIEDTEAAIQKEVLARLARIRWGKDGYLFVFRDDGVCLNHINQQNIGQNMLDTRDLNGKQIVKEAFRVGGNGGGFVDYVWNKPSTSRPTPKLSYAQVFEPWGWVVGAGTYLDDIEPVLAEKRSRLAHQLTISVLPVLGLVIVTGGLAIVSSFRLSRRLRHEFGVFDSFFRNAADEGQLISNEELSFVELQSLASSANEMVEKRRQDEEALRRSEGTLRSVVQAAPIGIGLMHDQVIDWTNDQLVSMTGYTPTELKGMRTENLYDDQEESEFVTDGRNTSQRDIRVGSIESRWRRKDGSCFDLILSSAPV